MRTKRSEATAVPLLDVRRQNSPLRVEIDEAIAEVNQSAAFILGPACREFEAAVADYCQTSHAIGCASGSDALLLTLMAFDIGPGDEVILPSFTFFATAGSVWRLGAKPVFADIVPNTFNIDPDDIERKITPNTKAIIPVHLFGQCAQMWQINEIAAARNIPVIEDAAQAIGARYQGRLAGSLGTAGCFSFYPSKNLGGFGDGGMVTTNDDQLAERLKRLRNHGQHPIYQHDVVGVNSRLDALQAAVLKVKLPWVDRWGAERSQHADRYAAAFADRDLCDTITVPSVADDCQSVWNQYTVRVQDSRRDALRQFLADREIGSAIYYPIPLHLQTCFASLGYEKGSLPHTEQASQEVLSLPVFPELTPAEQDVVVDVVTEFCRTMPIESAA
jgi:dTDP-4-amino-4,6-dideoxygalactose transaminase